MSELYNKQTGKRDEITDPQRLTEAILTGSHDYKRGSRVFVTSPDGDFGDIPAESVRDAIQKGYRVETYTERVGRQFAEDNKGIGGAIKVGVGQFLDEGLTMGLGEMIYDKTANPFDVAKKNALKKEHQLINDIAGVGGFGASLVTGPAAALFKGSSKLGQKTTALIGEKIGVQSGQLAGKAALKNAAKDLVAKTAGAGVEGTVASLPQAITEAALGDPDQAAETLLYGVGLGSLFGAGGSLAGSFKRHTMDNFLKGPGTQAFRDKVKEKVHKLSEVFGVDSDAATYYSENMKRLKNADVDGTVDDVLGIKSKVDDAWDSVKNELDDAGYLAKELDDKMRKQTEAMREELKATTVDRQLIDDIADATQRFDDGITELDRMADNFLERTGIMMPRSAVQAKFTKRINALNKSSSKAERNAAKNLEEIRGFIGELDAELQTTQIRQLIKDIRKDAFQHAKDGNSVAVKQLKELQYDLNRAMKDKLDDALKADYQDIMDQMRVRIDASEKAAKYFGTPEKADKTLRNLFKPEKQLEREALEGIEAITGENFLERLRVYEDKKNLLNRMSLYGEQERVKQELFPNLYEQIQANKARLEVAKKNWDAVRGLSDRNSEQLIKRLGRKTKMMLDDAVMDKDKKALKALEAVSGQDFSTMIIDRGVLDALDKPFIRGSRMVAAGAALGGAVAGMPGLGFGAGAGLLADTYAGLTVKHILDLEPFAKQGLLFAEKAMKRAGERLDEIKLPSLKPAPKRPAAVSAINRLLGEPSEKEEKELEKIEPTDFVPANEDAKELQRLEKELGKLAVNFGGLSQTLAENSRLFKDQGAPAIGDSFTMKQARAIEYIRSIMPRPLVPNSPFMAGKKWRPDPVQMLKFNRKLEVVLDPFRAVDELESGTLTADHVEALEEVYPNIYNQIKSHMIKKVVEQPQQTTFQNRVQLSILFKEQLDPLLSQQNVQSLQMSAKTAAFQEAQENAQQGANLNMDLEGITTDAQRIASR